MPVYVMTRDQYEQSTKSGFLGLQREGQLTEPDVTPAKASGLIVAANVLNSMRPKVMYERLTEKPEEPDPSERFIVNSTQIDGKEMVTEIYSGKLQPDGGINITTVRDTVRNITRSDKPGMVVYPDREDAQQILEKLQERRAKIEYPPLPQSNRQPMNVGSPYDVPATPSTSQADLPMGTPIGVKGTSNAR